MSSDNWKPGMDMVVTRRVVVPIVVSDTRRPTAEELCSGPGLALYPGERARLIRNLHAGRVWLCAVGAQVAVITAKSLTRHDSATARAIDGPAGKAAVIVYQPTAEATDDL